MQNRELRHEQPAFAVSGAVFFLELGEEESHPLLPGIRQVACRAEIQITVQPFLIVPMGETGGRALCQYRHVLRHNGCRYINHGMLSRSRLIMKMVMLSNRTTVMK
jgi:hypothetical protein